MGNRFPKIFTGSRICIIYEGYEEYEYLEKVISLDVWSKEYCFQLENAGGNGNIPAQHQDKYQNGTGFSPGSAPAFFACVNPDSHAGMTGNHNNPSVQTDAGVNLPLEQRPVQVATLVPYLQVIEPSL